MKFETIKDYPWIKELAKKDQAIVKRWIIYGNIGDVLGIIGYTMIVSSLVALLFIWGLN